MASPNLVPAVPGHWVFEKKDNILLIQIGEGAQKLPCYLCRDLTAKVYLLAVGDATKGYEFWCGKCKPVARPGIDIDE